MSDSNYERKRPNVYQDNSGNKRWKAESEDISDNKQEKDVTSKQDDDVIVGYSEDEHGLRVEHISEEECAFLYDEIFLRRAYLQDGITLSSGEGDVLDVGANIGLFSIFCCQLLHHSRSTSPCKDRIFAFEPIPRIFRVLQRNVEGMEKVNARCFGLGASCAKSEQFVYYQDAPGESSRRLDESREQRRLMGTSEEGVRTSCEVRTLAEVIREEGIENIQLVKIDVEGDELEVLMGLQADDWAKIKQIVLEVCDRQFRLSRIQALLERNGFRTSFIQQKSEWAEDSLLFVPAEMRLFYVFATRQRK